MSGSRGSGFTIIEVMLFLAISGLLAVGIMAGAGVAINVQRYKDATHSLVSYIHSQYDKVANVQNDHRTILKCDSSGVAEGADVTTVGASLNCYVMGRLLTVSDGGTKITSQAVYGTNGAPAGNDIESLSASNLFVDTTNLAELPDVYSPEWSTRLVKPKPNQATTMDGWRLLIVRSPSTGAIRTFTTTDNTLTTLTAFVSSAATRADVVACVDQLGLTTLPTLGVKVVADASGASGALMTNEGEC